jgi:putative hydrolase of the HAD superfamily
MVSVDLSGTVVVLDLDDTIYPESDYQRSGLDAVCGMVETLYGARVVAGVEEARLRGERDLLGVICGLAGLPVAAKESLLWLYRLHAPSIALSPSTRATILQLEKRCMATLILTDGRSISQRMKLHALGLTRFRAYISEEYASEKPEAHRFIEIMSDFRAARYAYVADNPRKDFVAPNALQWLTIGVHGNRRNVHSQDCEGLSEGFLPRKWITGFDQLLESLC